MKILFLLTLVAIGFFSISIEEADVFGHGGPGKDRAPAIDFENKKAAVEVEMDPSDITVGDVSNAFMNVTFLDENTGETFKQVTYAIDVYRQGELLARNNFYAEDGTVTIDIRPNESCEETLLWKCSKYYGTEHPIAGALYTFGENNPVIEGPIFVKGGLYHINVEVLGAGSVRSNLLDPLEYDVYVAIAQEQTFYIQVPDHLIA